MIKRKLNSRLSEIISLLSNNRILTDLLVSLFGLSLLISSFRTVAATLIPFMFFLYILLATLIISILLTFWDLRFNSFAKSLRITKSLKTLLYFSLIVFIFFKINFYISFSTGDESVYEHSKDKVTHNMVGQPIYNIYIYDHQWDDWSSSGWICVDSATFYNKRDYITIHYNMGLFGFKVIPKNQNK